MNEALVIAVAPSFINKFHSSIYFWISFRSASSSQFNFFPLISSHFPEMKWMKFNLLFISEMNLNGMDWEEIAKAITHHHLIEMNQSIPFLSFHLIKFDGGSGAKPENWLYNSNWRIRHVKFFYYWTTLFCNNRPSTH